MGLMATAQALSSDPTRVETQTKERTREIVRAYRHSWDIYSELIQNAVDAINRRYRILNDPDFHLYDQFRSDFPGLESDPSYRGAIDIEIDVPSREITVRDNGVGIASEDIESFLLPEGSDKTIGQDYGFKGFGLTYAAFVSRDFYMMTRPFLPGGTQFYEFGLTGLFDWLLKDEDGETFPDSPIPDPRSVAEPLDGRWNTTIKLKLADDYSTRFPAVSSTEQAVNLVAERRRLRGFEYLLRTRTAIGNTRALFSKAPVVPIEVNLRVTFADGDEEEVRIPYEYDHPKDHSEVSAVAYDFGTYVEQLTRADFNKSFRGLYHTMPGETVGERRSITCDFALAAISSTRLSNIEASLGLNDFETRDAEISYGVYLAIDGMPTGLRIDDWDSRGAYLRRYFVVVDADMDISNQLDAGRKGISQYYARMISDRAVKLLNESTVDDRSDSFARYASSNLDHGRGREEGGLPPQDFANKVRQVREAGKANQEAEPQMLAVLESVSSLTYLPMDEQEVVALFYELCSQKIIKGYRSVYLGGSREVYDAAFDYVIECVDSNVFPEDPLGVGQILVQDVQGRGESIYAHRDHFSGITAWPELCVDFKKSVGGFLQELQRPGSTQKDPRVIDILVVWDTSVPRTIPSTSYTMGEVYDNRRIFHGTTHRLGLTREYNTEILCIVLKDILSRLSFAINATLNQDV